MALANVTSSHSTGMPSAPFRAGVLKADLDSSYPAGGYSLATIFKNGETVKACVPVPTYNGSTLRWAKIVDVSGVPTLKVYANSGGAVGSEVAGATDLHLHTDVEVPFFYQ